MPKHSCSSIYYDVLTSKQMQLEVKNSLREGSYYYYSYYYYYYYYY